MTDFVEMSKVRRDYLTDDEKQMEIAKSVREKISETLNNQKDDMIGAFIEEIHPDINVKYNSVNVIVGKQGQGKTVIALQEIIKIGIAGTHHLFVYVTKDGNESDRSFLALKPLIEQFLPILTVSENDAQKTIENIIQKKNEYYKIKRNNLVNDLDDPDLKITPEETQDIFDALYINNFDYDFLHTIVLFDDISNSKLFANETSYFSFNRLSSPEGLRGFTSSPLSIFLFFLLSSYFFNISSPFIFVIR